jgi:hypothetical protein
VFVIINQFPQEGQSATRRVTDMICTESLTPYLMIFRAYVVRTTKLYVIIGLDSSAAGDFQHHKGFIPLVCSDGEAALHRDCLMEFLMVVE